MTNVLQYLEQTVREKPYHLFLTDGQRGMTFREVYDQARAIGSCLIQSGVVGKAVAVLMEKTPRTVAAFLGAIYGGNYYVPLDSQMPRGRLEAIVDFLAPGALLWDESTRGLAEALPYSGTRIGYSQAAFGMIQEEPLRAVRKAQLDIDPIYVVFTSGSTGIPKGVVGCHRGVIDYVEQLCPALGFDGESVFGNQTPLYFDACLKELFPAMKYGGCVHLIPRQLFSFPVRLVEYLNQHQINTLCWVASAMTMVSNPGTFERIRPRFLRTVAFASEVLPVRQLKAWRKAAPGARFFNLYGPTETTGICCYYEICRELEDDEPIPIGAPFPNTQILLLDEEGRPAAPGAPGEIYIRGTRLTLGYYRSPEQEAGAFVQNPLQNSYPERVYRTGDMAMRNSRGELVFLGRRDQQIKRMGRRIELGEIEAAAGALPGVDSAGCVCSGEPQRLILFYTGPAEPEALLTGLKQRLPRYMLPNDLRPLEAMPRTPNGKLHRSRLRELADQG